MIPLYTDSRKKIFTYLPAITTGIIVIWRLREWASGLALFSTYVNVIHEGPIGIYYNYCEIKAPFMSWFCLSTFIVIVYSSWYQMNSAPARVSPINFNNCMRQKLLWWRFRCNLMQITIKTIVICWPQKHSLEFTNNPNWFWQNSLYGNPSH